MASAYGIEPVELRTHGHHAGAAKFVAVELACRLGGLTQRAIGAHYGRISSAAVTTICRKIRLGHRKLGAIVERLASQLTMAPAEVPYGEPAQNSQGSWLKSGPIL